MTTLELDIDDETAARARANAAAQGVTLEELLKRRTEEIAARSRDEAENHAKLMELLRNSDADLGPDYKFDREATYDRRFDR